jgi:hypothetical protein
MTVPFDLFLFSTDPGVVRDAVASGVAGLIVDWERNGKHERQRTADTEINEHTVDDLRRVRAATDAPIICRVNPVGPSTIFEIDAAVDAGADEILVPMVRTVDEVLTGLDCVRGRCGLGILVETVAAVHGAASLARLPLSRVYVGLNDLMIDRGETNIFSAILDGTVERVRSHFTVPFGFAGLTVVGRGCPIPCRLLMSEMARLDCGFSFLRRSYHRDIQESSPRTEIPAILTALAAARSRGAADTAREHRELMDAIRCMSANGSAACAAPS